MFIKIKNKKALLIILLILLVPGFAFAINILTEGYQVASTVTKIDAYGTCKNVSATDGQTYFVPTNSQAEWQSVVDNKPAGLQLNLCLVNGVCGPSVTNKCLSGTPANSDHFCGVFTWDCLGSGGGANVSCVVGSPFPGCKK